jgi:hypothetical protein
VLKNQRYSKLNKNERGLVCQFLTRVSGLSRAQTARLIRQWMADRQIRSKEPVRRLARLENASEQNSASGLERKAS